MKLFKIFWMERGKRNFENSFPLWHSFVVGENVFIFCEEFVFTWIKDLRESLLKWSRLKMGQHFDSCNRRRLVATENDGLGFCLNNSDEIRVLFRRYQSCCWCHVRSSTVTWRPTLSRRGARRHNASSIRPISRRWRWRRLQTVQQ